MKAGVGIQESGKRSEDAERPMVKLVAVGFQSPPVDMAQTKMSCGGRYEGRGFGLQSDHWACHT